MFYLTEETYFFIVKRIIEVKKFLIFLTMLVFRNFV